MNEVKINNRVISLPSQWNDLTFKQLYQVCSMFDNNLTAPLFKVEILFKYLSIKRKVFKTISAEDAYFLTESLSFLLEAVSLTNSLVKGFRSRRFPFHKYYGPDDAMSECTFGEFVKAQVRYEDFHKTSDPATLDEMVAILYRRKKPFWFIQRHFIDSPDCRIRFMDRSLAKRKKDIAKVDPILKKAILLFFSGVQASLPLMFPNVYKSKPSSTSGNSGGWTSLVISLADGKTDDRSLNRIMNSNLYNVFLGLEQKSIEYFEFLKNHPTND